MRGEIQGVEAVSPKAGPGCGLVVAWLWPEIYTGKTAVGSKLEPVFEKQHINIIHGISEL